MVYENAEFYTLIVKFLIILMGLIFVSEGLDILKDKIKAKFATKKPTKRRELPTGFYEVEAAGTKNPVY